MKQLVNRTSTDRIACSSAGSSKSTVLLSPLAVSLRMMAVLPVMLATPAVAVEFLDAETRAITSSTPADSYQLINGSVLNAQGAQTAEIEASNSTVNFTGGGIATTAVSGLRLVNSQATVRNAQIVSTQGGGMTLVRTTSLTTGSTASVTDSVVRGGTYGAQVTAYSELSLRNSMLTGTGANSSGARLLGGTLNASGGQIRGEENGVWLLRESVTHPAVPQLQLDNTHVESGTGSAVRVTSASGASIVLSNGTTLTGGNGVILELGGGALPLYRSDARILWAACRWRQTAAPYWALIGPATPATSSWRRAARLP